MDRINLDLTPQQNTIANDLADKSAKESAQKVWNIYGNNVPIGAYNALDPTVKSAYENIKEEQRGSTSNYPGMFDHNIDVPKRPRD